ncbi:MAG: DNA polymerase III subunit gamma/tau [Desulfuromonadales bacterium]|nr:DNA polymerase III subunit gamma/tau [Desulfuromonadales bacterium]
MSYQVLARKWRPQNFDDLVGQEHVSRTLANAMASGRIHHAFLFTGARGVGKTSAARILAKALNCEAGLSPTPCNLCPSCVEITNGQGIDVLEIDGASNNGVDEIRELRESIRYLPSRGRYRIIIIDEVHMLSTSAFNALLKTLEEPPPHVKFIFATTEPHKIPITILSRCQRFDFRKISLSPLVARLRSIVDAEKITISDLALTLIARRGEGSMRDALSALDQMLAFCGEVVADADVQGLLGLVDRRLIHDTVEAIVNRESHLALETLRRIDEQGYAFRQFAQELVEALRGLILLKVTSDPGDLLDVTTEERQKLQSLSERATVEDLQRAMTLLLRTESELAHSTFPRLLLEMTLIRLCYLPPTREIAALLGKIDELERRLGNGKGMASPPRPPVPASSAPLKPATPSAPVASPRVAPQETNVAAETPAPVVVSPAAGGTQDWPGMIAHVRAAKRPRLVNVLEQASLLEMALPTIRLGLPKGSLALEMLQEETVITELRALADAFFGSKVDLRFVPLSEAEVQGSAPPSLQQSRRAAEENLTKELNDEARGNPVVRSVCDLLGGEIVEVRPVMIPIEATIEETEDGDA